MAARTNVLSTIRRIRRQTGFGHVEEQGVLFAAISDIAEVIQFKTAIPDSVHKGVNLDIDLEILRVVDVNQAANIVSVLRGYLDSTATAHSANALIDIGPRFSRLDIFDAIIAEIDSWGQELYYVESLSLPIANSAVTFELPPQWSEILGIVDLRQSESSGDTAVWPELGARLIRGTPASFVGAPTSGMLLRLTEGVRTGELFITVALSFDASAMTVNSDLLTDLHLIPSMLDVLEMGARIRLIMNSDDTRTARGAQDEPRRAEETPMGSMVSLSQLRLSRYMRRKSDEMSKLRRRYPLRMT